MPEYSLNINLKAEFDLVDIYTDGFTQWGEMQADVYYDRLCKYLTINILTFYLSFLLSSALHKQIIGLPHPQKVE